MSCPLFRVLVLYLAIIFMQSSLISSQNTSTLSVGDSLLAISSGTPILSPSGDFAFGFHPFPTNKNTTTVANYNNNLFILSIWYAKIPDTNEQIVWYANDGNPVPLGSKLTITADEGLILSDPQGTRLWSTTNYSSSGTEISYGFIYDTGNFVLQSSDGLHVWETFNFPTDTLLPTQVWNAGNEINSRLSESNFTKGRFQLRLLLDGNLVLNTRDLATDFAYGAYNETGTNNPPNNKGKQVVYNDSGNMYILREDNITEFDLINQPGTLKSTKNYYQRATLNYNGVLTWYSYPRDSTEDSAVWYEIQSVPDNICMRIATYGGDHDSGACGCNSICHIDNQKPVCKCPPNYSLIDPCTSNP